MSDASRSIAGLEIKLVQTASVPEMVDLYKDAGWWEETYKESDAFLKKIPGDSALFAGAFINGKMVGMGRALSDLCSDAYIQDIVVLSDFQEKGIGRKIVRFLIKELKARGVDWIGLIGEPGTQSFYEKMGFKIMKDYIPFKLEE